MAKQVDEDYYGMEKVINQAVEENADLALSSNPFDYIKDNSYYTKLVNKGVDVLPILEDKLESDEFGDGLLSYITAIAIQDIADCNLKQDEELQWATASEFKNSWKKFKKDARGKVNTILTNKKSEKEKKKELEQYGVYAVSVLKEKGLDKQYGDFVDDYKLSKSQHKMLLNELQ